MVRQAVPLQPMEINSGAAIHLQPVEDLMPEQVDVPKGGSDTTGSLLWSELLGGPVEREAHAGAGFLAGLVSVCVGAHAGAVCS